MELIKSNVYATSCFDKAWKAAKEFNAAEIAEAETDPWTAQVQKYGDNLWIVMLDDYYGNELGSLPFTTELVFDQNGSLISCKMN